MVVLGSGKRTQRLLDLYEAISLNRSLDFKPTLETKPEDNVLKTWGKIITQRKRKKN